MGQFKTLKLKSERVVLKLFFEVNKKSRTSNMQLENAMNFIKRPDLSNLNSAFNRNSIGNSPSYFFGRRRIFSDRAFSVEFLTNRR